MTNKRHWIFQIKLHIPTNSSDTCAHAHVQFSIIYQIPLLMSNDADIAINQNSNKESRSRKRKRNVIWFKPTF